MDDILTQLDGVRKVGKGYQARCPNHDDRVQSLSVSEEDGKLLLYCHAGCSFDDIMRHLNVAIKEREEVAHYDYFDGEGTLLYQVVRFEPKGFSQRRPDGDGWAWDRKGTQPVLYNLPLIINRPDDTIFFVEGEKDCQSLGRYDLVGTTVAGGASQKWQGQYTEALMSRNVVIVPDNDKPGKEYAQRIAEALYGWASSIKIINLDTIEHGDITDWLQDNDINKLWDIIDNSPEFAPPPQVTRAEFNSLRQIVSGLRKAVAELHKRNKEKEYYTH